MKIPDHNDLVRIVPLGPAVPGTPYRHQSTAPRRKKPAERRISLALQGGGSFGAFTWGVLDRLLEEEQLGFDAISGASAGAVNAVMLASGLAKGGRPGARRALHRFWERVSEAGPRKRAGVAAAVATQVFSPYQFNPFNLNPFRAILSEEIDFAALRRNPPVRLLIAATRVADGKARIFREKDLTLDVILASACLPLIHHAVSIDGETYWDGGYSANPPLIQLVRASRARDALIVQIMPTAGEEMPTRSPEIVKRMEQITFNSSLLHDMEALSAMTKLSGSDPEASPLSRKLQRLRLHHIAAEKEFPGLSEASALELDWGFLVDLRDRGRNAAEKWLRSEAALASERSSGSSATP